MQLPKFNIYFATFALINCAPTKYDEFNQNISSEAYDIDSQQLQARYDSRLISEDVNQFNTKSNAETALCWISEIPYSHGQKVPRYDPCEMCVCVDGEIFCWWKKCDHQHQQHHHHDKQHEKHSKHKQHHQYHSATIKTHENLKQSQQKNYHNIKKQHHNIKNKTYQHHLLINEKKNIPKNILDYPPNHPPYFLDNISNDMNNNNNNSVTIKTTTATTTSAQNEEIAVTPHHITNIPTYYDDKKSTSNFEKSTELSLSSSFPLLSSPLPLSTSFLVLPNNNTKSSQESTSINPIFSDNKITEIRIINTKNSELMMQYATSDDDDQQIRTTLSDSFDGSNTNSGDIGKGYYEKTIINKNGVFIENIRKIADLKIDNNKNVSSELGINDKHDNGGHLHQNNHHNDRNNNEEYVDKKTDEFLPLSEHYLITATGKIEKPDDVISATQTELKTAVNTKPFVPPSAKIIVHSTVVTTANDDITRTTLNNDSQLNYCIVAGKTYKIGEILPQEIGNCLQCICGIGNDDDLSPRVTCSSHNCPPLILPDLFDANGY